MPQAASPRCGPGGLGPSPSSPGRPRSQARHRAAVRQDGPGSMAQCGLRGTRKPVSVPMGPLPRSSHRALRRWPQGHCALMEKAHPLDVSHGSAGGAAGAKLRGAALAVSRGDSGEPLKHSAVHPTPAFMAAPPSAQHRPGHCPLYCLRIRGAQVTGKILDVARGCVAGVGGSGPLLAPWQPSSAGQWEPVPALALRAGEGGPPWEYPLLPARVFIP